ncbi:MAG: four helix bundle protein [Akkermansiaceae bacterium]|nr:four helix bundle protein [Verrucomicrobiales bacterium]
MNSDFRSQISEASSGKKSPAPATSFEPLIVRQKAHQFVLGTHRFTDLFPRNEIYGLISQFRRAAVSIPANIAEGFKKRGRADKVRHFNIAPGSLEEGRHDLILAKDLNYGDPTPLNSQLQEVSKLLGAYSAKILASDS